MDTEEFRKALRAGKIEPVYLFLGPSTFLMGEAWNKLLSALLPKAGGRFNGERLQAKETEPADLIARLAVVPMFGGRRAIMVDNVEAWGKGPLSAVEAFVRRIPASACLVMTASSRKSIEGLAKAVEAKGKVILFRSPGEREAPRWLVERARQMGKTLSNRAAFLLVETSGTDLQTLASELDKICTFAGERDRIEPEDILEAAGPHRTFSAFDLLDHIKGGQADKALASLRSLVLSGELPLKILSTLAWQIRIVWQVKDGLRQGIPESQLAKRIGAHPFVVKKASEQAGRFSDAYLYRVIEAVGQTDIAIKSTGTSPELLLEDLVLNLTSPDVGQETTER
ncbi:MAG: DNA polymerase III subunit delta [Deltaproteobacteria bacterium]|jgi:DNA polymerase-3 subunit delta|nr:DNA polymerase III subunit delta [Deltaproteobacteria bacterium]